MYFFLSFPFVYSFHSTFGSQKLWSDIGNRRDGQEKIKRKRGMGGWWWKTSMTNKKAGLLAFFGATSEQVERGKCGNDLTRRDGRKGGLLLAPWYFSILFPIFFSPGSLSSSPLANVHREMVEECPRVAGQEWQREWQPGWSYTLDPEGMQRSTVERESNERVVLLRLV